MESAGSPRKTEAVVGTSRRQKLRVGEKTTSESSQRVLSAVATIGGKEPEDEDDLL